MKKMLKDAAVLFVITLVAGCLLGAVYEVTKEPIKKQQEEAWKEACQAVFPTAVQFENMSGAGDVEYTADESVTPATIGEVDLAMDKEGNTLGYVLIVTDHEGYGGDIRFAMGIGMDGTLYGISFLSISETAGLGMRADEVLTPQFAGKNTGQFKVTKIGKKAEDEIDAISGATITSNAVTNGVNAGLAYFEQILQPQEGGAANE